METKTVNYNTLRRAISELNEQINPDQTGFCRDVTLEDHAGFPGEKVQLKINWCCKGAVTVDEAAAFVAKLTAAVEAARSFQYNGFHVVYHEEVF